MSNGPRTAPVRPGRHRGARSVRRESDANRIMFIYTISLGAARFTFLRENERVNSNYNLVINVTLYLMLMTEISIVLNCTTREWERDGLGRLL